MYICMLESIQMRGTLCMTFRVSVNVSSNSYEKSKCVFVRVLMPKKFRRWETLTWNKDPQRQRGHCCFPAGQKSAHFPLCLHARKIQTGLWALCSTYGYSLWVLLLLFLSLSLSLVNLPPFPSSKWNGLFWKDILRCLLGIVVATLLSAVKSSMKLMSVCQFYWQL